MRLQVIEPEARFSCSSCGACCNQPWRTVIDADRAAALSRHDFAKYPALAGRTLFHEPADRRPGFFDLAKGEGNRCLFLDADGLCIIHKELGADAKPLMCQQFPLIASRTWGDQRITLNYACPSVQSGKGRGLQEQADEVSRIIPAAKDLDDTAPRIPLDASMTLSLDENEALLARLGEFFQASKPDDALGRSLAAVETVRAWSAENSGPSLSARIAKATVPTPEIPMLEWPGAAPLATRMLLAATLQPDTVPVDRATTSGLLGRITMIPKLMSLASFSGGYPSRILGRNLKIDAALAADLPVADDANVLLARYMRSRIWARTLMGTRLSILAGLHQHILDLCAAFFFARAEAVHQSSSQVTQAHIARGLQAVEMHLANQSRVYDQVLRGWLRSQLNSVEIARSSFALLRTLCGVRHPTPASVC